MLYKKTLYLGALDIVSSSSEAEFVHLFALLAEEASEVPSVSRLCECFYPSFLCSKGVVR